MGKTYELTESDVPARHTTSLYPDIVADFLCQSTESMQVTIEGMKPATLRAGLRRALKGKEAEGVGAGAERRGYLPGTDAQGLNHPAHLSVTIWTALADECEPRRYLPDRPGLVFPPWTTCVRMPIAGTRKPPACHR